MKIRRNLIQICLLCVVVLQAFTGKAQPVTKITAGYGHNLLLKSDDSLWAVGDNIVGELGDGTNNNTNRPEQIVASNVMAIAAAASSLFLKSDGSLWAMGDNAWGELGDGTYNRAGTNLPEQIVASNVTAIAAGEEHSLFLKSDGSLWGMGDNSRGELGVVTTGDFSDIPVQIVASNVTAIAAGSTFSLFLMCDGSLWAMGNNFFGQLGDGTYNNANRPEQIVASNVVAISAGRLFSLFLKSDGSLWAMGYNSNGQLGDGTYNTTNRPEQIVASNVVAISAGWYFSLFLKNDGSLWAMGANDDGQLGDSTYNDTNLPQEIVTAGITTISAGIAVNGNQQGGQSLFVKSDGSLWGMGDDSSGELGDGTFNSTNRPEQILAAYNQISVQLLSGGNVSLSFVGIATANYALDCSFSLSPANWIPQVTNSANSFGALVFTNMPNPTTNNFWRIRSVP